MTLTAVFALATAAAWATAAAPAAHADSNPSCALTSSAPTNVVSTSPPGFSQYWADNNVAVVPIGSGQYQFINSDFHYFAQPPDGTFVGAIQGTLDNPESDGVVSDVGIQGFKASPRRYAGVTSNVYVASTNLWIGIYHDEEWNNGNFYSREGFAKSTDQGHTWYDLGETLSPHVPYDSSNTHQIDLYISAFAVINSGGTQYVYEYFKEPNADGTLATQLSVARAPLADLIADAQAGTVPLFYKYYNGSWSEPGLGGNASELRTDGTGSQYFTGSGTIIYDTAIGRYLMFGYTNNGADVDAIESADGLTWGNPQMLFANTAGGAAYYSTPVGLDGNPTVAGSQFYLYTSVVNLPGSDILQRRTLTCTSKQSGTTTVDDAVTGSGLNQFNYQGAYWGSCSNYCSSPSQYLGTEHWDATAGETASVAFSGTGISLYTESGPGAGYAGVSIDGGPETIIDTYAANEGGNHLVWASPALSSGAHTLTIRVTGTHDGSATNSYVLPDRVDITTGTTTVDDAVTGSGLNQFNYQGAYWGSCSNYCSSPTQYLGTEHWDATAGETASIAFNGTAISLYTESGPGAGYAGVSIDGGPETIVDTYAATEGGNHLVWTSPALSSGAHTLTIRVTGTHDGSASNSYVLPDRVDITTGTTTVDDAVTGSGLNQFNYQGSDWGSCSNYCSSPTQYLGTEHWDATAGETASVAFNGTGISLYTESGPGAGYAGVSIDGGPETIVDTYAVTEGGNHLVWASPALSSGAHTLTIRVTGTHDGSATNSYVLPDRVDITG